MSQENVELSKRVVDAWNRRDVEATVALADPEVVWHPVLEETIEGEAYRGHAGLRQYYKDPAQQGVESQGERAYGDPRDCSSAQFMDRAPAGRPRRP